MKKIIFALAMSLFMLPAFAQHHDIHHDNHHDTHRHDHHDDHHHGPAIRIASPEEVDMIYHYIKSISFDKDKMEGIKICMQLTPMTAEDIARLVGLISFDDTRLETLKFCYPLCPNKDRYMVAVDRLSFSSNKDKMVKFMAHH
ncbi:MAG: DUF4476 domain-containing protein [Bacteroidales bacterium]|nr:DUF4476 domain-containing protein [Bacteroidales bacterium]